MQIFFCLLTAYCLLLTAHAQKIAVLVPIKADRSEKFVEQFRNSLSVKFNVLDESLSETAFRSNTFENPFNISTVESKNIGAAIGCEYFLLIKSTTQRRSSFQKEEFYESFAAVYVVSSRTGRLVVWKLQTFEAAKPENAEKLLLDSTGDLASEIFDKLKSVSESKKSEKTNRKIEEVPDENTAEARNLRPPLPYKRLKPEYTRLAYIYDVKATVDITVDLDENGAVTRTEIVRWAGFGLDESVTETVRRMNWRAATRNGKTLPMRVLLRYNFKKIEKEEL
ncbi:MAG: energy transducer TonB [Acidobacteriota bacterium]|nr:energy transducer TonB [Acidobacteriota bacterium]